MNNWEHLNILTKDEIIEFLKNKFLFCTFEESDVLFFKWNSVSRKLIKKIDEYRSDATGMNLAVEHSRLTALYNKERDSSKKLKLLHQIMAIDKKLSAHREIWFQINGAMEKNDKLFKKAMELRERKR